MTRRVVVGVGFASVGVLVVLAAFYARDSRSGRARPTDGVGASDVDAAENRERGPARSDTNQPKKLQKGNTSAPAGQGIRGILANPPRPVQGIAPNSDDPVQGYRLAAVLDAQKEDNFYRQRVPYEEVAKHTRADLVSRLGPLEDSDIAELIRFAREQQRQYWAAGDLNSSDAYRNCYAAQAAVELALEARPNDPALYEELAEIICAAHPLEEVQLTDTGERGANDRVIRELVRIRSEQTALYERSEQQSWPKPDHGISAVFKAYMELAHYHCMLGDGEAAASVLGRAAEQAERGGWGELAPALAGHAQIVRNEPWRALPPAAIAVALRERVGQRRPPTGSNGEALAAFVRPWARRGMFFEGPNYVKRVERLSDN